MKTILRFNSLTLFMLLFTYTSLISQISISGEDILKLKGTERNVLTVIEDSVFIDIQPGGINQTWDYRNVSTDMFVQGMLEYLEAQEGFRADLFPDANFRQRISGSTEDGDFLMDQYMNISSSNLTTLGMASNFAGFSFTEVDQNDVAPLPMTFGTNWLSVRNDTTDQIGFLTITIDSTWNLVDGYGTLRLLMGDIECLRLREMSKTISSSSFNGTPLGPVDTTYSVSYVWISREHLQTFIVDSTDAGMGSVSMMLAGDVTSVDKSAGMENIKNNFRLEQNYPNPFNPSTSISYSLPYEGHVTLKVFDVLGAQVAELVNGFKSSGNYTIDFNASSLTSGIYFYKLQSGDLIQTKKMILMQ